MKVWRTFMEEWEQTAKQFKSNAEFLESLCQDKLTHLYQDKRKARKNYQEEHQKIATQFTNVSWFIVFFVCDFFLVEKRKKNTFSVFYIQLYNF